jgi:hypothetical protein
METLYFTLGIAFVVVLAVAGMAVWAAIKVAKLNAKLRAYDERFASTHRDITMIEQTLMNVHNTDVELLSKALDERFEQAISHTDSRFDKLDNKVQNAFPTNKQLLKG